MLKKLKKLAKDVLAIDIVRRIYVGINRMILNIFASNRLFATIYSIPGLMTFNREQYAVLRGRRNYYRNLKQDNRASHVELRRNIHRLEKGLIMQPRRSVFARDYISETVDFYKHAVKQHNQAQNCGDIDELTWAHDVLERFFKAVDTENPIMKKAYTQFTAIPSIEGTDSKKAPYLHKDIKQSSVTYQDMLALSTQRRSNRWFKNKKIPRDIIDKAMMVARQAPSACNRLPYEFKVFDDPELVKQVVNIPFGTGGYAHQVPAIVVIVGKLDGYFSPRDRHNIYVDSSLAAMSFMFALETLGLSSSVVNWPDFEPLEIKMQKALGLDPSERVIMSIVFGYPDEKGGIPFSQKKSLEVIRSYNQTGK